MATAGTLSQRASCPKQESELRCSARRAIGERERLGAADTSALTRSDDTVGNV
jgi:hypothetical protein